MKPESSAMLGALSDSIRGLLTAISQLEEDAPAKSNLDAIVARGEFRPVEDEAIGFWFARFLSIRENLWEVIAEVRTIVDKPTRKLRDVHELQYFLVGYAAVCLLVKIDRLLLFDVADHSIVQRKLNERFPEYRIPAKQFTRIFSAFVDQADALAVLDAMRFAAKNRRSLLQLREDPAVGFIAQQLRELESSLDASKRNYLKLASAYVSHKWRRRSVVSVERVFARVLEGFGRAASEFCEMDNKNVTSDVRTTMAEFLQPGDVIVTRHAKALTNLFFPGFWPHAAFYVGTAEQRQALAVRMTPDVESRWVDDICVLEARKDGVCLRPLSDTLVVDAFAVLRPNLDATDVSNAIQRALLHEGKKYNFDFNFFNSDRVVCTEVIYRAYDGTGEIQIPLTERAGRKTLSAEDLLDYALDSGTFTPVAIFGADDCKDDIVFGDRVRELLVSSYRSVEV